MARRPALKAFPFPVAALLALAACATGPTPHPEPFEIECGKERWQVKTLTDAEAGAVDLEHVRDTTVEELATLPRPRWHEAMPRLPAELTTWRVRGVVTWAKLEEDGDWHIVLQGESGRAMIVEVPDPRCAAGSRVAAQLAQVRRQVAAGLGGYLRDTGWTELDPPVPVTVTGVGFFDKMHGQRGVAPPCDRVTPLPLPRR